MCVHEVQQPAVSLFDFTTDRELYQPLELGNKSLQNKITKYRTIPFKTCQTPIKYSYFGHSVKSGDNLQTVE